MYAKNLKLHKGVDNRIQFQFINQEQKPVNITDKEITCRIISYDGKSILLQKALTLILPVTGIAELQLSATMIENIDPQLCSYSLEIPSDGWDLPVFVDSNAGARGVISVVNSVLPSFVPSQEITIPTHPNPTPNSNAAVTFYSSVLNTNSNPIITLQSYLTGYTGNVQVQGSTLPDADWYSIGNTYQYANTTSTNGYTFEGFHPYIRLQFVTTAGTVNKIIAR